MTGNVSVIFGGSNYCIHIALNAVCYITFRESIINCMHCVCVPSYVKLVYHLTYWKTATQ